MMKKCGLIILFVLSGVNIIHSQSLKIKPNTCFYLKTGTNANIETGNLILESDETGDASLIDKGSIIYSGGGHAVVQRYLTGAAWHLVSSPVGAATAEMFLGDYLQMHHEPSNDWTDITATGYELAVMQGYALWSVAGLSTTEQFDGITNSGDQDFDFEYSGDDYGFNLIGNPYPSQIDWDAVILPEELGGAFWTFDPALGNQGDYRYYIPGGGAANTTSRYIPMGQGFFVRAVGIAGTISFGNDVRCHGGQAFQKDDDATPMLILKTSGNNITTQAAIRFSAGAGRDFDRLLDVDLMTTNSTNVGHLYSVAGNHRLVINTLPEFEGNESVLMAFTAGTAGIYRIMAEGTGTFGSDVSIFLEDLSTAMQTDLKKDTVYSFNHDGSTIRNFRVHFKSSSTVPEPEAQPADWVRVYTASGQVHVDFSDGYSSPGTPDADIFVSDLTGRVLLHKHTCNRANTFRVPDDVRFCLVTIVSGKYTTTVKVINMY